MRPNVRSASSETTLIGLSKRRFPLSSALSSAVVLIALTLLA